jgi:hypothetical protein
LLRNCQNWALRVGLVLLGEANKLSVFTIAATGPT